jgi:hypothetical protein
MQIALLWQNGASVCLQAATNNPNEDINNHLLV